MQLSVLLWQRFTTPMKEIYIDGRRKVHLIALMGLKLRKYIE